MRAAGTDGGPWGDGGTGAHGGVRSLLHPAGADVLALAAGLNRMVAGWFEVTPSTCPRCPHLRDGEVVTALDP